MRVERQEQTQIIQIQEEPVNTQEQPVGMGRSGGGDTPPDVLLIEETGGTGYERIFRSLSLMIGTSSQDDQEVALMEVMNALANVLSEVEEDKIVLSQEQVRTSLESKLEKLEEADRKLRRAMRKDNGNDTWSKIKIAASFASALATMAIGAIMIAGTAGACHSGYCLVASGAYQMILAVDSLCTELTGHGLMGNLVLLFGGSEKQAADADLGFRVYLTVCVVACAIASGVLATPASSSMVSANLLQAKAIITMGSSIVTLCTATGDSYYAVRSYEAADLNRDSKNLRADGLELEALIATIMGLIDAAMAYLRNQQNGINTILDRMTEVQMDTSNTLARTKV